MLRPVAAPMAGAYCGAYNGGQRSEDGAHKQYGHHDDQLVYAVEKKLHVTKVLPQIEKSKGRGGLYCGIYQFQLILQNRL